METETRFPHITVQLSGSDGNAFSIIGKVRGALKRYGVDQNEIDEFTREAQSGDYDHMLRTAMRWVDVS